MTSAMPVQCSNQLSYEVTQWRAGQFVGLMFSRERNVTLLSYVDLLARFAGCTVDDDSLELVGHGVPGVVVWPLRKSKTSGLAAVLRDHS